MSATRPMNPETASTEIPEVPLTLEGFSVLHQMLRFRRSEWRAVPKAERDFDRAGGGRDFRQNGARKRRAIRLVLVAGPQGRPDVNSLPQQL